MTEILHNGNKYGGGQSKRESNSFYGKLPMTDSQRTHSDMREGLAIQMSAHLSAIVRKPSSTFWETANSVWMTLINPLYYFIFFSFDLQEWLQWNGSNEPGTTRMHKWKWQKLFGHVCWRLWKNRCQKVFEGKGDQPRSIIHSCLHQMMEETVNGKYKHQILNITERPNTRWIAPPEGFLRLDVDGSRNQEGYATCGGVIRDHLGRWLIGYQHKVGLGTIVEAEIQAIISGINICKNNGLKNIKLFSDSSEAL